MWSYISFRSLLALMLSLIISMTAGKSFITYMKRKRHIESARDAEIDPYGVQKKGTPSMGGIIIVDFIDMNLAEDRQMLYERMCKNMQKDRARHNILPLSKFGLMQITRQRVRPAMDVNVDEECPTCFGTGKIRSSILFTDQLERKIENLVNKIGVKSFYLHVHPYVAAYINQGIFSLKRKWQMKYGLGVHVVPSQKMGFLQYEFYDSKKQFFDMKEEIETK